MRAIVLEEFGGPEVLRLREDVPEPALPGDGVRIAVHASGVNPTDWKMREGLLRGMFPHVLPAIPGWELAGVVLEVGAGVHEWKPGDEVYAYARTSHVHLGTYAEQCVLPASQVARKPAGLSLVEAAAVPLAALTAFQLLERVGVGAGDSVLVQGASGGVGHFAVQLAKARGATVTAVARQKNHPFVLDLGADAVVDHTAGSVAEQLAELARDDVTVVVSTVGLTQVEFDRIGRLSSRPPRVTTLALADLDLVDVQAAYVAVRPDTAQLDHIATLVERGAFRVALQDTLPLERAAEAQEIQRSGQVRGKLALRVQ